MVEVTETAGAIPPAALGYDKIAEALASAELTNPQKNRSGQCKAARYHYADLSIITETARPQLAKVGIIFTQIIEPGQLVTMLIHKSGQYLKSVYPLPAIADSQAMGSAITYARRYALTALLGIAADDDDDGNAADEVARMEKEAAEAQARAASADALKTQKEKAKSRAVEEGRVTNAHTGEKVAADGSNLPAKDKPGTVQNKPSETAQAAAETKPEAKPERGGPTALDGIARPLRELMSQHGIKPGELSDYATRHLKNKIHPKDFTEDYVGKMVANWAAVLETLKSVKGNK